MAEIDEIRKYVEEELGGGDAGLVVLSAFVVGPNIDRIAKFTGLSRSTVREYAQRLRDNGIWRGSHIVTESGEMPDGIEAALMVGVAVGHLEVAAS